MIVADRVIIGAGIYGLYAGLHSIQRNPNEKIVILECDKEAFSRATYINQARIHMGYHYPRSLSTAKKSAMYFKRFVEDYSFCILDDFQQIYATSNKLSWTNASQFSKFCHALDIKCDYVDPNQYFYEGMCSGAFLTQEYTYDAAMLKQYFLKELKSNNVEIHYSSYINSVQMQKGNFIINCGNEVYETSFVLNATYASTNQISEMFGYELFRIKYELCEMIICSPSDSLKNIGLTVMDGPFFSIMPFGKTGLHSLSSVLFTPHVTCYKDMPDFACNAKAEGFCSPSKLGNCNLCDYKPQSAWKYMSQLARKYMREVYEFSYVKSLFSVKPILMSSEVDDSRPTVIKKLSTGSSIYVAVLSGKINTVYDLDEVLDS